MCGIAGIFEFGRGKRADAAALREMCHVMAHRGPDDDGFYTDGSLGIGMRRLSIVDIEGWTSAPFERRRHGLDRLQRRNLQPPDSSRATDCRGHRYSTHSDTETIIHLYEEYGAIASSICAGCLHSRSGTANATDAFHCARPARHQAALLPADS